MPFDRANALEMAQLVQLAYELDEGPIAATVVAGLDRLDWGMFWPLYVDDAAGFGVSRECPIGFAARKEGAVAVVFRGTDRVLEALQDVVFTHAAVDWLGQGCCAEQGFLDLYRSVRVVSHAGPRVGGLVAGCCNGVVRIAGHSLGGALATLLAAEVAARKPAGLTLEVTTFGSPRTGNTAFAVAYDAAVPDTYRVVNPHDLVPAVPVELAGYAHVDQLVTLDVPDGTPHGLAVSHALATYTTLLGQLGA